MLDTTRYSGHVHCNSCNACSKQHTLWFDSEAGAYGAWYCHTCFWRSKAEG